MRRGLPWNLKFSTAGREVYEPFLFLVFQMNLKRCHLSLAIYDFLGLKFHSIPPGSDDWFVKIAYETLFEIIDKGSVDIV